jgi:hypothetical protein
MHPVIYFSSIHDQEIRTNCSSIGPGLDNKDVYITAGDQVHHVRNSPPMDQCNHEEADTCILVDLFHALQISSLGMVHTGDTDVVVTILRNFHHIKALNPAAEIWISFKAGKDTRMISMNTIATNLGTTTCKGSSMHSLDQTARIPSC